MRLDEEALTGLRDALIELREAHGRSASRRVLARLADIVPRDVGLTIDFEAGETLGHPLVVLRPRGQVAPDYGLSPREREVAGLVATGLRNKDIALALGISVATVKDHVHRILTKTGSDSRTAVAALWAAAESASDRS